MYFPHLSPKSLSPRFQVRASYGMPLGERGDQKYEDLPLSPLFKNSCWESEGLSRQSPFPCGEGTVSFLKVRKRKTHSRRDIHSCHYLQSQLNPIYAFSHVILKEVEGQSPHLSSHSRYKERLELFVGKGEMGQNSHFSQMNFVEEIFLSLGSQSGDDL